MLQEPATVNVAIGGTKSEAELLSEIRSFPTTQIISILQHIYLMACETTTTTYGTGSVTLTLILQ